MTDQLTSVTCNKCGAPLQVPETTRFLTCSYCGTQLEIRRSGNAVYTEILQSIDHRTQQMANDLEAIKRQNEVERLDREWQMRRESLLVRGKNGSVSEPSAAGGLIGALIAGAFGVFWTVGAASAGAPGFFVLFGVIFIAVAVIGGLVSVSKSATYKDEEQAYRRQRDVLMRDTESQPTSSNRID